MTRLEDNGVTAGDARKAALPMFIWLGLPLLVAIAPGATRAIGENAYQAWFRTEGGAVELATALFLFVAVCAGLLLIRRGQTFPRPWLRPWFVLFTLGCIYFLGEEISWGQHIFGWSTPEALAESNDQGETNLHNLGGWVGTLLDQAPRLALTLAALVGGLIGPLYLRQRRLSWNPERDAAPWIWPTIVALPAAVGALTISLPRKLMDTSDIPWLDIQTGESKEAFLALFLMLYAVTVLRTCPRAKQAD
ncbi:MAG: hypothetical protein ACI8QS_003517 [Planctomycetota bacterium]|jgi:hypothetical protein